MPAISKEDPVSSIDIYKERKKCHGADRYYDDDGDRPRSQIGTRNGF